MFRFTRTLSPASLLALGLTLRAAALEAGELPGVEDDADDSARVAPAPVTDIHFVPGAPSTCKA